jgi:hypothetical protein
MNKELFDMIPDEAWNHLMKNELYQAINSIRARIPFLDLVRAKDVLDQMKKELGML